jgi:hypothetical protein
MGDIPDTPLNRQGHHMTLVEEPNVITNIIWIFAQPAVTLFAYIDQFKKH